MNNVAMRSSAGSGSSSRHCSRRRAVARAGFFFASRRQMVSPRRAAMCVTVEDDVAAAATFLATAGLCELHAWRVGLGDDQHNSGRRGRPRMLGLLPLLRDELLLGEIG